MCISRKYRNPRIVPLKVSNQNSWVNVERLRSAKAPQTYLSLQSSDCCFLFISRETVYSLETQEWTLIGDEEIIFKPLQGKNTQQPAFHWVLMNGSSLHCAAAPIITVSVFQLFAAMRPWLHLAAACGQPDSTRCKAILLVVSFAPFKTTKAFMHQPPQISDNTESTNCGSLFITNLCFTFCSNLTSNTTLTWGCMWGC